jgi:hypothetical protein
MKEICQPCELPWGSACYSWVATIHFRPLTMAGFSPRARARPKAAAQGDEEVGLPGKLVRVQQAVVFLPDPHFTPHGRHLSAKSPYVMLRTQAV